MYVSDFLDTLINATHVREMVAERCRALVEPLPPALRAKIVPVADYIGRKCMGYPPIWLVQQALELPDDVLGDMVDRAHTAIFTSLSTSIADDLLDESCDLAGEQLMMFYLLIFGAMSGADWNNDGLGAFILDRSISVMPLFVGASVHLDREALSSRASASGKRIGSFHEMIAYDLLRVQGVEDPRRGELVALAGRFGSWCAFLDDAMDIERDIVAGELANPAVELALHLDPKLYRPLKEGNLDAARPLLGSRRFARMLAQELDRALIPIVEEAARLGLLGLVGRLEIVRRQLPTAVPTMRAEMQGPLIGETVPDPGQMEKHA